MSGLVIDASLAAAWCFPDEQTEYTNGVLRILAQNITAFAPPLLIYELHNCVLTGLRRKRITPTDAKKFLHSIEALGIKLVDPASYETIFSLAERYGLTFYDASYLDLALRKNVPLASLDKELCLAATQANIALFHL